MMQREHIRPAPIVVRRKRQKSSTFFSSLAEFSGGLGFAWKATTAAGVLLCFGYFVRYRYSPIDSLGSVGAVAGLVAVLAMILSGTLFAIWAYPAGLLLALANSEASPALRQLFDVSGLGTPEPSSRQRVRRLGRRVLVGASWVWLPWMAMVAGSLPGVFGDDGLHRQVMLALLAVSIAGWMYLFRALSAGQRWLRIVLAFVSMLVLVGPVLAFFQFAAAGTFARERDGLRLLEVAAAAGLLLTTVVMICGVNILREGGLSARQVAGHTCWMFGAFVLLMISLGAVGGLLDSVMAAASVRVPHARIVLAQEACEALDRLPDGATAAAPESEGKSACTLKNVLVVSRIGEQWRLGCPGRAGDGMAIDAKQVRIWAPGDRNGDVDPRIRRWCSSLN
ncbi:hypothetical protein [Rhizobacter sp. LjRoot28]|uniref:hypothetical protein n=1 Tax=Rhizobacter sp. LjRoot28 TaxID=3342309 RepID=UPI003ECFB9D2